MEEAIALRVPLTTDPAAPCRLTFGDLGVAGGGDRVTDRVGTAVFFEIANHPHAGALGRVTFEGLDSLRVSRGETAPFEIGGDYSSWVYLVEQSRWLAERHEYEWSRYQTPLLDSHEHYFFCFHDYFVEAIAEGIWLDEAPEPDPFVLDSTHPWSSAQSFAVVERGVTDGLHWEVRQTTATRDQLLERSRLCSQTVYEFALSLDGHTTVASTCLLRTRHEQSESVLTRPWTGIYARFSGVASGADLLPAWESYCAEVAERRRSR